MILPDDYVLYAIELRVKTSVYHGTLCRVNCPDRLLTNAFKYFDTWPYNGFVSHPFTTLTQELAMNMTWDVFRIFIDLNNLYMPPFTCDEIVIIMDVCKKFGYHIVKNKDRVSIKIN